MNLYNKIVDEGHQLCSVVVFLKYCRGIIGFSSAFLFPSGPELDLTLHFFDLPLKVTSGLQSFRALITEELHQTLIKVSIHIESPPFCYKDHSFSQDPGVNLYQNLARSLDAFC